ncbi:MAG: hypothetical protein KGZ42_05025 [Melioribacter sp.]|nr:hypothetical protein [Melioribacter sp.]
MRKKNVPFFLIFVLLTFCAKDPELLPNYFFELNLTRKLTGSEAKNFVNRLHFNSVTNEKNEIGFYGGVKGNAIIYVTFYENESVSIENYKKMTEKISPENSVFTYGAYSIVSGRNIYQTYGMGQTHYVFTSSNKLFWISAEPQWAQDYLTEYLKILD